MSDQRTLRDFGRDSFTPILGQIVPWDGSVLIGGERIFLTIDHGQIIWAEIPTTGEYWGAERYRPDHWRVRS